MVLLNICAGAAAALLCVAAEAGSSPAEEVTAHLWGATIVGQPRAEVRVKPDRLVGKPGAKPICGSWVAGGERAAARIRLVENRLDSVAFPYVVASAGIDIGAIKETTYTVCPNHVEKEQVLDSGLTAHSVWFVSTKQPLACAVFEFRNPTGSPVSQQVTEAVGGLCVSALEAGPTGKSGAMCRWQGPRQDAPFAAVSSSLGGAPSVKADGSSISYSRAGTLTVPANGSAACWIALTGARDRAELDAFRIDIARIRREMDAALKAEDRAFSGGPKVVTPDEEINVYFDWTKAVPWKCSYQLPIGEPYALSSNRNKWETVLCAVAGSGNGVWANDCVQTLWECSTLGPEFYPIIENTLESFYGHGLPESVEFWNADGTPWYVFLKIGQQPEWVMAAANYLLVSGDPKAFDRFWPKVRQVLQSFHALCDYDRDWLDDYSTSPYPEQPFTGPYNHEMLYASCYWYAAFDAASEAAALFGRRTEAEDLRWQAGKIREAINKRFATDYGYASWLKVDQNWKPADKPWEDLFNAPHEQHPSMGHNMTFPCEYGIASPEQAEKALKTLCGPLMMTEVGPRVAYTPTDKDPVIDGSVWNYNRWNLVRALYRYGHTDEATRMLRKWVDQESGSLVRYQSVEMWSDPNGISNLGFVWTAGRAMRAILFGLYGLEPLGDGLRIAPKLPSAWPEMKLLGLTFRGTTLNISVVRGAEASLSVDGKRVPGNKVAQSFFDGKRHEVTVVVK